MLFRILHNDQSGELTYLLADAQANEAVLVDPHSRDVHVLLALLDERELRLRWVLRTHEHDDQMPEEFGLLRALGGTIVQGRAQEHAMTVQDGELLPFGDEHLRVMLTPGHTPHCMSFAWRDRVFCGGLLAVDACPRQAHPAEPATLWDSVTQRIFTLPDETLLFAGHERRARAVSTVLEQRRWHPHFTGITRDVFLARMVRLLARSKPAGAAALVHPD